jgi:hypothetical protein
MNSRVEFRRQNDIRSQTIFQLSEALSHFRRVADAAFNVLQLPFEITDLVVALRYRLGSPRDPTQHIDNVLVHLLILFQASAD